LTKFLTKTLRSLFGTRLVFAKKTYELLAIISLARVPYPKIDHDLIDKPFVTKAPNIFRIIARSFVNNTPHFSFQSIKALNEIFD
jgi:hypothetical protein